MKLMRAAKKHHTDTNESVYVHIAATAAINTNTPKTFMSFLLEKKQLTIVAMK